MPELPEVEVYRQYIDATSLHQDIQDVEVRSAQVLPDDCDPQQLREALKGHSFKHTQRHGKYLFVGLNNGRSLELHFGMSGDLKYFKHTDDEPDYTQVLMNFANGYHLAYTAPRKLGEIQLLDDVEAFVAEKALGPDVLDDDFDLKTFQSLLAQRRGMIKSALMDQQLMAGIGNVYSDEILFQVKIHPRTKVQALKQADWEELYHTLRQVLTTVIESQADLARYPEDYLTPEREPNGQCPVCGNTLARVKVSGRSAYYCPNRQGQRPSS